MLSPLRYPGGKSDFAQTVCAIVRDFGFSGKTFVEPYAGSAIVTLNLLEAGLVPRAILIERDIFIYAFWKVVFSEKINDLIARFLDLPITLGSWEALRPMIKKTDFSDGDDIVDYALAALFFNRANFSGILKAGPIGGKSQTSAYPIDCRTNKDEIIVRLLAAATFHDLVDVYLGDALDVLDKVITAQNDLFLYVDPPYYAKGELLYRHFFDLANHRKLSEYLRAIEHPWLLSYDAHHVIEFLYEGMNIHRVNFKYSARNSRPDEEFVISNFEILEKLLLPVARVHRQAINSSTRNQLIYSQV